MPGLEIGINGRAIERKRVGDHLRNQNAKARAQLMGEFSSTSQSV